jgi:hypothetical protein
MSLTQLNIRDVTPSWWEAVNGSHITIQEVWMIISGWMFQMALSSSSFPCTNPKCYVSHYCYEYTNSQMVIQLDYIIVVAKSMTASFHVGASIIMCDGWRPKQWRCNKDCIHISCVVTVLEDDCIEVAPPSVQRRICESGAAQAPVEVVFHVGAECWVIRAICADVAKVSCVQWSTAQEWSLALKLL